MTFEVPHIPIVAEESHYLLINKPAGLFSQAANEIDSVERRLIRQLKQRDQHPGVPFVGLPHRLDRGTSGIMLIAKNQRALKRFGQQFQSRKVGKFYLAVVHGAVAGGCHQWEDKLQKVPDAARVEVVATEASGGKLAKLSLVGLATDGRWSLLLIQLHTGRMHQIRVQAASRGLPVIGDNEYGGPVYFQSYADQRAQTPLALHAVRLEFRHPQDARLVSGTAPVPPHWQEIPSKLAEAAETVVTRSGREAHTPWGLERVSKGS